MKISLMQKLNRINLFGKLFRRFGWGSDLTPELMTNGEHRQTIDWLLFLFLLPILGAGLITMKSFNPSVESFFFQRQIIWFLISVAIFFSFSFIDFRFLKRTKILVSLLVFFSALLVILFLSGSAFKGATSWFDLGRFSFQPVDMMKLVLVLVLAKYFSRRHIEIANFKHILISGLYAFIPFVLVLLQPDFGSAVTIFLIWLGMTLVSGISKKHLLVILMLGIAVFVSLWFFVFQPYQKARIMTFIHPLTDIRGAGYSAYQSVIAIGSGGLFGKGVGYGTQSRLQFLPEYQTDFIFAAFAEEWGFVGVFILLFAFGLVLCRILSVSLVGASNFEMLYGMGVAIFLASSIIVNIGMNIGLLPVTGVTLPFMSYGGSHLLTEFMGLGILMSMRRYRRAAHPDDMKNEFLGI